MGYLIQIEFSEPSKKYVHVFNEEVASQRVVKTFYYNLLINIYSIRFKACYRITRRILLCRYIILNSREK